jgi:hypothetical protein
MAMVYLWVDHITADSVVPNDARSIASATAITLDSGFWQWLPAFCSNKNGYHFPSLTARLVSHILIQHWHLPYGILYQFARAPFHVAGRLSQQTQSASFSRLHIPFHAEPPQLSEKREQTQIPIYLAQGCIHSITFFHSFFFRSLVSIH